MYSLYRVDEGRAIQAYSSPPLSPLSLLSLSLSLSLPPSPFLPPSYPLSLFLSLSLPPSPSLPPSLSLSLSQLTLPSCNASSFSSSTRTSSNMSKCLCEEEVCYGVRRKHVVVWSSVVCGVTSAQCSVCGVTRHSVVCVESPGTV